MDFWTRLVSHASLSSGSSRKDAARDPAKRLHRFEREYSQLLHIWRNSSNLARDVDAAENLESRLRELTTTLGDESQRPLPHPCIQFAALKQIYVPIGKIATTSYNEWIIKQAVLFFATLIESEEEAFVENPTFSASLTSLLVRITGVNSVRLGPDTEARVVELAFNITTKIRLAPEILPAWFKGDETTVTAVVAPADEKNHHGDRERFAGRTQKQDFPLFYILLDYIHHEGKVGDFARTGLLYIIESASSSVSLEQWIVESDLSTLMATGLGALYSQLSRKLVVDYPPHELPPVLALSDYQHPTSNFEIVSSCSPQFQAHLETFLSHLLFWQDVLNHCRSPDVKSTLLEHFQVIFLQQLLYPSLLESSDVDGGSSVAVLTYLRRILESLDHPDMIDLILHYLLALPEVAARGTEPESSTEPTSVSAARKRKSMDLATMLAQKPDILATPVLYNLVDMILACLRSHSQQTIHVTLQLVSTVLRRHHRYAVTTLLRIEPAREGRDLLCRTVGAHDQEVDFLMSLAALIGGQDDFDEIYEGVLRDTTVRLECHPCSLKLVAPRVPGHSHKQLPALPDGTPGAPQELRVHTLRPDDALLNTMLDLLDTFFVNPVDTNLSVTEALSDLAVCGYMRIEGWLVRSPHKYVYIEDEDDSALPLSPSTDASFTVAPRPDSPSFPEYQNLRAISKCRQRPRWDASSVPRLSAILKKLGDQVALYRESIPRFDELLQQRREAFQTADGAQLDQQQHPRGSIAAAAVTPDRRSTDEPSGSPRPSGLEGFAQRLLSELGGTPTRSASPRGRADPFSRNHSTSPAPGLTGGYGLNTPISTTKPLPIPIPNPSTPQAPKEFPLTHDRSRTVARSYSPSSIPDDHISSSAGRARENSIVASQMAAFAAVDQSILARKVTLPGPKAIPINLSSEIQESTPHDETDETNQTSDTAEAGQENPDGGPESQDPKDRKVSVSHVLTNTIILQSFLFELASIVQVRASLFDEVRFV